jgi:hypothetical protein
MWNFLFEVKDEDSEFCGELFFVQCDTIKEAWYTAHEFFEEELAYRGRYSDEEAESMGYDTY